MNPSLHPVARYAHRGALIALGELEREIDFAETSREAVRIYDLLTGLYGEVDRLERRALDRAEALLKGSGDVRA